MEISQEIIFKSVFQGVFWKDNAKGFSNLLSKEPVHISKWVKITTKDTPNSKKKIWKPSSEAVFAKFKKWTSRKKIMGSSPKYLSSYIKSFEQFPQ